MCSPNETLEVTKKVQRKCYKGIVRPILEYAAPVWDLHPKRLQDKLEMVQRRSERHSCGDFKPTSSASALVKMLNLDPRQLKSMSNKVIMLYKTAGGLIDAKP